MNNQGDLIERLKRGDTDALATVFEAHSDKIYGLAVGILHDEQQADGVVQDTFIKLIKSIDTFKGRSGIGTWLYRVAYNECMGRLRRIKPDRSLDDMSDHDFMPDNFTSWNDVPDEVLTSQEAITQMQVAIDALSPTLQIAFKLRDIEGFTTAETASILKVSESVVKVRLHRARLELREMLADYFEEYALR